MKNLLTFICLAYFIVGFHTVYGQEMATNNEVIPSDYLTRNPIYDYSELHLNNTDTIPDFATKTDKLKISGTIYQSDGTTPAKDVLLYISQTDEDGNYELKKHDGKRYVQHRGWIKTDADGQYTFYTFVPGTVHRSNELKRIHPVVKESGQPEQEIDAFLFDDDPLLTKRCRKKLDREGYTNILTLEKKNDMLVTTQDIVLSKVSSEIQ